MEHDDVLSGTAFVLGDDVNTDLNCTAKYLPGKDEAYIATRAFEAVSPGFAARFRPGGVIAAGRNFGINSSREQSVRILKRMGVAAVIAPTFGRQFFRNAINNGLLVLECETTGIVDGDVVSLDRRSHVLTIAEKGIARPMRPLPRAIDAILRAGGLLPFLRQFPDWQMPDDAERGSPEQA